MLSDDDARRPATPVEGGRVPVPGVEGWSMLPFEHIEGEGTSSGAHRITLVSDGGSEAELTLPAFVEQGDELEEILRLVVRARERWAKLKGLGA
jgi:hypothetical protein